MTELVEALGLTFAMGAVILFCRAFPFIFFSGGEKESGGNPLNTEKKQTSSRGKVVLDFVEKIVPPAAMTVLAFNALGGALRENPHDGLLALAASALTALLHVWKRNSLISIFGGTVFYMLLVRICGA